MHRECVNPRAPSLHHACTRTCAWVPLSTRLVPVSSRYTPNLMRVESDKPVVDPFSIPDRPKVIEELSNLVQP